MNGGLHVKARKSLGRIDKGVVDLALVSATALLVIATISLFIVTFMQYKLMVAYEYAEPAATVTSGDPPVLHLHTTSDHGEQVDAVCIATDGNVDGATMLADLKSSGDLTRISQPLDKNMPPTSIDCTPYPQSKKVSKSPTFVYVFLSYRSEMFWGRSVSPTDNGGHHVFRYVSSYKIYNLDDENPDDFTRVHSIAQLMATQFSDLPLISAPPVAGLNASEPNVTSKVPPNTQISENSMITLRNK